MYRKLVSVGLAATMLTAGLVTSVAVTPVIAADEGGSGPSNGGTGGTGTNSGFKCRTAKDNKYSATQNGKRVYDYHTGCDPTVNKTTNNLLVCEVGMMVFRFYGTLATPAAGGTVSRVMRTNPCAKKSEHPDGYDYRLFNEHPDDAGYIGNVAPWRATKSGKTISHLYEKVPSSYRPAQTSATANAGVQVFYSGRVNKNGNFSGSRVTTGRILSSFGKSCTTYSKTHAVLDAHTKLRAETKIPAAERNAAANEISSAFLKEAADHAKTQQSDPALQAFIYSSVYGINVGSGTNAYSIVQLSNAASGFKAGQYVAKTSAGTIVTTNNFKNIFHNRACGSKYNFVTQLKAETLPKKLTNAEKKNFIITGQCYIPVTQIVRKSDKGNQKVSVAPVMGNYDFGERFSTKFSDDGGAGTAKAKSGLKKYKQQQAPAAALDIAKYGGNPDSIVSSWRAKMGSWYTDQAAANKNAKTKANQKNEVAPYTSKSVVDGYQKLPAPAYVDSSNHVVKAGKDFKIKQGGQNFKVSDGKSQLINNSICDLSVPGVSTAEGSSDTSTTTTRTVSLHTMLNAPKNLFAGGVNRESRYTLTPDSQVASTNSGLVCTQTTPGKAAKPCDLGTYKLKSFTYSLDSQGINTKTTTQGASSNYIQGNAVDANNSYYSKPATSAAYGSTGSDAVFGFYRATPMDTLFRVNVKPNATAVAEVSTATVKTATVWLFNPFTGRATKIAGKTLNTMEDVTLPAANIHVRVPGKTSSSNRSTWFVDRTVTGSVLKP